MRTVAIVRVSTVEQAHEERYSVPHQKSHILEECRHRGLALVHFFEFVQSGATVLSDSSQERQQILKFIQEHEICAVIVHELDRLARSMLDTLLFVDRLNKQGVTFISIHDGFDTSTAQGQLQMHILAAFAEYFRKQLAGKVTGGMLERAKQGRHLGRRPMGYRPGPAGFEIDEEEARVIRQIYTMYLDQNLGLREIAGHLNSMGFKSRRGSAWSHVSVRGILENEVYTGTFTWGEIRIEDNHPAIIDRSTWKLAQERRRRKKIAGGRAQNSFYLLSGLLYCGTCEKATLVGRYSRKGKYGYRYYVCNNYASRGAKTCPSGYFPAVKLEECIEEDIMAFSNSQPARIKNELLPFNMCILKEQIELKNKELTTYKKMLERAAEAYEKGMYDLEWFSKRKLGIEKEREKIIEEITILKNKVKGNLTREEINERVEKKRHLSRDFSAENDFLKTKTSLQQLIDYIKILGREQIEIYYRF